MENTQCPIKGCLGKLLCTAIPVFIFLFGAGFVINHVWLMPLYQQTASVWRPMGEMEQMMPWLIAYYAVLALAISALFCKLKKAKMAGCATTPEPDSNIGGANCPIKCGLCFGLVIGVLLGASNAGAYIWLPIPGELAVKWFIGWLVQGIGSGVILALICHCKKNCAPK